jgi:hypothetical protein
MLSDFLKFLYEDTHGFVHIAIKADDESWRRTFAEWPRQYELIVDFISQQTAEGSEVFLSPALWKEKPSVGKRNSNENFLGSHVLWAEFDGNAPDSWDNFGVGPELSEGATITPGEPAGVPTAATAPARPIPGPPSWVNATSSDGHQHVYWKAKELITDADLLENINKTIAVAYEADNCWDATRVLRPPDTTNYGIGKPERNGKTYSVRVEEANLNSYDSRLFGTTRDFRSKTRNNLGAIPDIREVLARRTWDEDFYKAFVDEPAYKKRSDVLQFLAYSAAESGFSDEEIYSVLQDADDRWKKYTGRLDREKWLVDHVDRARAKYPLGVEVLTFEGLLGTKQREGTESLAPPEEIERVDFNLMEFMALDLKIEWLIQDLLPRAGYGVIAGQNGIGKSQMGIRLCEAVVGCLSFLIDRWHCNRPDAKAMFLSLEMEPIELREFYQKMMDYGEFFADGGERFTTIPVGNPIPLDRPEGYKFLESMLDKHRPDLLVIDSLSVAMAGSFRDDGPSLEFNKVVKKLRRKFKVAIVVIHHNRKGQDKKFRYNELDDLYGSRFLSQDTSFVLMIDKPRTLTGDTIAINQAKIRFSKAGGEIHVEHTNMAFLDAIETDALENLAPVTKADIHRETKPKPPEGKRFGK